MTETTPAPAFTRLELRTAYGPAYRQVSTAPPRDCRSDEIPVIDITDIYGDLEARTKLAAQIKNAAMDTGFFYIKNHGINTEVIEKAHKQALT
jgi:hypothetical protein